MRIGIGYDVHKLVENRPLVLGGFTIPHTKGLLGHSDADVLTHAIIEAILGALNLGNIGTFFPDTDPTYKNISSLNLLTKILPLLKEHALRIGNIDTTIIAQNPKLNPYINDIKKSLLTILNIPENDLSIKATTSEHLGFIGREEGIAVHAIILLKPL
ncbi:MAG: 2-C-methyl-D-erythritol 2,4-cyclodiphosphate synthase [Candidatus Margulisbacteria bacterium]|nr:2-C-methyl-D-erythritol 2,4-cyclodiphosphate synthase [Candidatus Margulisiibacteriota bacterium]